MLYKKNKTFILNSSSIEPTLLDVDIINMVEGEALPTAVSPPALNTTKKKIYISYTK